MHKVFQFPLHCQSNPYIPKKKLINGSKEEDYSRHICRRDEFKEKLHERIRAFGDSDFKIYNGSNQIAPLEVNVREDITVFEFVDMIKQSCQVFERVVNEVVREVL